LRAGEILSTLRNVICGAMAFILPISLVAADSGPAILYSKGGLWVNGNVAPASLAIFADDLVQTQAASVGKIDAEGSTVTIQPDTIVQFQGDMLVLDHGTLLVSSSRQMRVRVGCLTVIPLAAEWTQYDVIDVDSRAKVFARKGDVRIRLQTVKSTRSKAEDSEGEIVHEGEQSTREERCGTPSRSTPGYISARGAIMNSPWVKWPAVGAIAIMTCWVLCRGDDPVSPSSPRPGP
jgi:hypothetical protein